MLPCLSVEYLDNTLNVGGIEYNLNNLSTYEKVDVKLRQLHNQSIALKKKYSNMFNDIMNGVKINQKEFDDIVTNINEIDEKTHMLLQKRTLYDNKVEEKYEELLEKERELTSKENAIYDHKIPKELYKIFGEKRKLMKNNDLIVYPSRFVIDVKKDDVGVVKKNKAEGQNKKDKKDKDTKAKVENNNQNKKDKKAQEKNKQVVVDAEPKEEKVVVPKLKAKLKPKVAAVVNEPHHVNVEEHNDIRNRVKKMILDLFVFKNKEECISNKRSQPFYVKKGDIISTIQKNPNLEKLMPANYQDLKKEQLCEYFFD